MDQAWHRDDLGRWTLDYQGSTLSLWQSAGVWLWEAAASPTLVRRGSAASYHQAKLSALAGAEGIAQEGAD